MQRRQAILYGIDLWYSKAFENEYFNLSFMKNDYYSAFVQFVKSKEDVMNMIEGIKGDTRIEKKKLVWRSFMRMWSIE